MSTSEAKRSWGNLRGGWLTFWITVSCATDMALFGYVQSAMIYPRQMLTMAGSYDQGVFSGVVITKDYLDVLGLNGPSKTNLLSIITAIYDIGCFFGAIIAFTVGERLGRKKTILIGTTTMAVGCILQTSAFSPAHMIVGRIVSGLGNGMCPARKAKKSKLLSIFRHQHRYCARLAD